MYLNQPENFNDLLDNTDHNRKLLKYANNYVDGDLALYANDPETIIIEKERKQFEKLFLDKYKQVLSLPENIKKAKILQVYCDNDFNITEVARIFNIDRKVVYRNIQYCKDLAKSIMIDLGIAEDDIDYFFRPPVSLRDTSHSVHAGFPMDKYINMPEKHTWENKYGAERGSKSKKVSCCIPEYLEDCGLNCNCCLCAESCTRSDRYPENKIDKVFLKNHEKELRDIIANIKEDMKNYDYSGLERKTKL